jgi:ABC-type transport system substrate-binding protein
VGRVGLVVSGALRRVAVVVVAVSLVGVGAGACRRGGDGSSSSSSSSSATTTTGDRRSTTTAAAAAGVGAGFDAAVDVPVVDRRRGGTVRVGVWANPDPASPGLGGAAVRALVHPQLFVAQPDGRWSPSLVAPGSDRTAEDRLSGTFRFREGVVWSDGSPVGVADLQRTMDVRFVSSVEAGAAPGEVVVRFTQPLPGWRRLWSGPDSIAPPAAGVWGGPFSVASMVPGLETVLVRNDAWWGGGPFLDGVTLVLVPDATTARQLLGRGELDVVMPPAATVRREQLARIAGVSVDAVERGAWSVSLVANPDKLSLEKRRALFATLDRSAFVSTLLRGEATVLDGFAGPEDGAWAGVRGAGDASGLRGSSIDVVGFGEEPMTPLVHRSMQKRARATGGTLELRLAEADRVEGWVGDGAFDAAVVLGVEPLAMCWRCRFGDLPEVAGADAGDGAAVSALEARLRDEARVLPLWRASTVVAWRASAVGGVRANGYASSGAWNAWEWFSPGSGGG